MAIHSFKIETDFSGTEYETTKIYLDNEIVYEVDKTRYYGIKKDCSEDICKLLEEKLGRSVNNRELSIARILEQIADSDDYK